MISNKYSFYYSAKTRCLIFKLIKFVGGFCKHTLTLNLMPASCSKKSWNRVMFTTVLHHPFFSQHSVSVWEVRANCWSFDNEILSHSCFIYDLRCSTIQGLCCCILHLITHYTFSMEDRTGLQTGQCRIHSLLLWSHAAERHAESVLSYWNKQVQLSTLLKTFTCM